MTSTHLRRIVTGLATILLAGGAATWAADADHPVVVLDTSAGPITVELDRAKAPITVDNFLKYVDSGYYNGTTFHRVIKNFMIQGGGMVESGGVVKEKAPTFPQIRNESGNGLSNARGTIAMARTNDPNSASSQILHQPRRESETRQLRRRIRGLRQGRRRDGGGGRDRQQRHDHQAGRTGRDQRRRARQARHAQVGQTEVVMPARWARPEGRSDRQGELDPRRELDLR